MTAIQKKINAITKAKNEAFAKMSRKEQRIAIARDVLDWIKLGKLIHTHGTYVEYAETKGNKVSCDACAVGSMLLCALDKEDKLKLTAKNLINIEEDGRYHDGISKYFSTSESMEIERVFENGCSPLFDGVPPEIAEEPSFRLTKIMENIVANGGDFKPEKGLERKLVFA